MMFGGDAEVPVDGFVVLGEEAEAAKFVDCPGSNGGIGDVAYVSHVEAEQSAYLGFLQFCFNAGQAFTPQTVKMDALFPVNSHRSKCFYRHYFSDLRLS